MSAALFEPIRLRSLAVRNRLWVAPMCQYSVDRRDGVATPWHHVHLGALARGGAGVVMVEATGVVPEGRISPEDLGLWNDEQTAGLAPIVEFMHEQGAAAGIQLAHAGRKASTYKELGVRRPGTVPVAEGGWRTVGPSAIAFGGLDAPDVLDVDGIAAVVRAFAEAARRAVTAGFDLVEIHAAHGYLLHSFLSPLSNRREDGYGGSLENRARIVREVVAAVRAGIGDAIPLLVRFSATDWVDGGWTLEETEQVVEWVAHDGADLVDISSGGSDPGARIPAGPGYQVPFAEAVRRATRVPTGAVGRIDHAFQAEQIVLSGQADVVLVGRGFLRNPHFALQAARELRVDLPYAPPQYARAAV